MTLALLISATTLFLIGALAANGVIQQFSTANALPLAPIMYGAGAFFAAAILVQLSYAYVTIDCKEHPL